MFTNASSAISEIFLPVCVRMCVCFVPVISYMLSPALCSQNFQEMFNASNLWIIFQTHFNSDLSLHPRLPCLTLFNTPLTLQPPPPGASLQICTN